MRGNLVRNGRDRRPETRQMRSPKVLFLTLLHTVHRNVKKFYFLTFLWTVCSTQTTVESMMTRMMRTAFRCSKNRQSSWSPLN